MCPIELSDMTAKRAEGSRRTATETGVALAVLARPAAVGGDNSGSNGGCAAESMAVHRVAMSDTFASLAVLYSVSPATIRRANGFKADDQLCCRREVRIPLRGDKADRIVDTAIRGESPQDAAPVVASTAGTVAAQSAAAKLSATDESGGGNGAAARPGTDDGAGRNGGCSAMEQCRAFLSQCDKKIASLRQRTGSLKDISSGAPNGEDVDGGDDTTPHKRARSPLQRNSMRTTEGRLLAEDQARDAINRVLFTNCDDAVAAMPSPPPPPPPPQTAADNDLGADTDIFNL